MSSASTSATSTNSVHTERSTYDRRIAAAEPILRPQRPFTRLRSDGATSSADCSTNTKPRREDRVCAPHGLRELQVGSPVELKLALTRAYPDRRDAQAVAEELDRCFAGRRLRGSWYRLTLAEVREALGKRATVEAPARARAAAEAAAPEQWVAPRRGGRVPARRRSSAPTSAAADGNERASRSGRHSCS